MDAAENIRQIGIFIIAAQMLVHLAAGKQYEKYIKVIAGVIVLILFVRPFTKTPDDVLGGWQEEMERIEDRLDSYDSIQQDVLDTGEQTQEAVIGRIEEEVRARLSEAAAEYGGEVADVDIELEKRTAGREGDYSGEGAEWVFCRVRVTVQEKPDEEKTEDKITDDIKIDKITVGGGTDSRTVDRAQEHEADAAKYQTLFAQMLGVAQDKVEVTYRGGN